MKMAGILLGLVLVGFAATAGDGWSTDFNKSLEQAKKEGKHVLVDFSGSDWCGWCIKLDKEVFSQEAFKDYAKDNLVTVMLDFPKSKSQSDEVKAQNKELQKKYEVRGFPTVLVLNPDGELVAKTGYRPGGPEKYVEHLKELIATGKEKSEAKDTGADKDKE